MHIAQAKDAQSDGCRLKIIFANNVKMELHTSWADTRNSALSLPLPRLMEVYQIRNRSSTRVFLATVI